MGNKIITEKDFWICSGGNVPAPFQTTQLSTKKVSEHKYITVADKSTLSWIDFGCRKLMLIMAIIAAIVVVAVVATGGAALAVVIAAGAAAGAAGAAYGAVLGALICGQKAAVARKWLTSKSNLIIQNQQAITGDDKMLCMVFGETITFAPHIKNWWQAMATGAANYIGGILEGMLAGAAIGMTGGMLAGGWSAFAAGGLRGLGQAGLRFMAQAPMNVLRNFGASFGYAGGFTKSAMLFAGGMRGLMGLQSGLAQYGSSGQLSGETAKAAGAGLFGMETGLMQSVKNIASGNATWQDIAGLALMTAPVHSNLEEAKSRTDGDGVRDGEPIKDGEESKPKDEEGTNRATNQESDAPKQEGEFEAFEDSPGNKPKPTDQALIDAVEAEAARQIANKELALNKGKNTPKLSPCESGVYDPVTRKTFLGENFPKTPEGKKAFQEFKANASQVIKDRITAREQAIAEAQAKGEPIDPKHDPRIGGHSEVVALDKAIKAREFETGKPVTEADLGSFDLHNRHMPSNTPMDRCPNCASVTDGVRVIGGHK